MTNKIKYHKIITGCLFIVTSNILTAQIPEEKNTKQLPSISAGIGVLTFDGDIGGGVNVSSFGRIRAGYNFSVEQRIKNIIAFSVSGTFGKIADSENGKIGGLNFESKITQLDLNLIIPFDNNIILNSESEFAPYISGGIGFLKFDPYTDLYNKDGIKYNYWTDGSIRDIPQNDPSAANAKIIRRDYKYETKLTDSTTNYPHTTFAIPVGAGFAFKMTPSVSLNIGATYYITFTDWMDNKKIGSTDRYLFANASLKYSFGKRGKDQSAPIYTNVDFTSVDKLDTDNDGIVDAGDKCASTPSGVKVDGKGCPLDEDDDGVPDYLDKHPNTKKGTIVDEQGVPINEELIAKQQLLRDSIATERNQLFNQDPSLGFLKDVEAKQDPNKKIPIPAKLKPADINNDGRITTVEISAAIDSFFEGDSVFTVELINDLIDFFFEQ